MWHLELGTLLGAEGGGAVSEVVYFPAFSHFASGEKYQPCSKIQLAYSSRCLKNEPFYLLKSGKDSLKRPAARVSNLLNFCFEKANLSTRNILFF